MNHDLDSPIYAKARDYVNIVCLPHCRTFLKPFLWSFGCSFTRSPTVVRYVLTSFFNSIRLDLYLGPKFVFKFKTRFIRFIRSIVFFFFFNPCLLQYSCAFLLAICGLVYGIYSLFISTFCWRSSPYLPVLESISKKDIYRSVFSFLGGL